MQKMNISWNVKQINKMLNNGLLRFGNKIQRSYVWERERKSLLIDSLMTGFPVPPFYASKIDGKVYDFLDGKQRINAICDYANGLYSLSDIPETTYTDDNGNEVTEDFNGCKFSDLPECLQDTILSYTLTIYYYESMTDDQVRELFRRLNNGKPLSTKERNIASCIDLTEITKLGEHEAFAQILSAKGIESRKQIPIVMKIWCMLNNEAKDVSFATNDFNYVMSETKTTEEQRAEINTCLNRFVDIVEEINDRYPSKSKYKRTILKRIGSETHLVSLMPFIKDSINNGITVELMADWIINAFLDKVVSDEYEAASRSGSAKTCNIVIRDNELRKSYEAFFTEDENEVNTSDEDLDIDNTDDNEDNVVYISEVLKEEE